MHNYLSIVVLKKNSSTISLLLPLLYQYVAPSSQSEEILGKKYVVGNIEL